MNINRPATSVVPEYRKENAFFDGISGLLHPGVVLFQKIVEVLIK